MATKKISELQALTEADNDDVLVIVDVSEDETGETKKITKRNLLAGTGHTVEMSLNTTTYVLTLSLKNEAGTVLSTQTIDLPIEDSVTGITYDNGSLTVSKQSGATSVVSISGLINGLVNETTFNSFATAIKSVIGISTNTYDSTETYNAGDIVVQNEKIYKCKENNVTGTFNSALWDEISLYQYEKIQDGKIEGKVDKVQGKGLSTEDFTTANKNKLAGIETGAEVNKIDTVKVNNTALTPSGKEINIPVPTSLSELTEDSTHRTVSDTEKTTWSGKQNALTAGSNIQIDGNTISATDTTYNNATESADGLMSSTDKTKLNGIESGAEVNLIEKVKLNGTELPISEKTINIPVDDELDDESENPVQNKILKAEVDRLQNELSDAEVRINDLENNQLEGTASGTEIDLTDSADSRVKSIELEGNSTQETTEGNQIFDKDYFLQHKSDFFNAYNRYFYAINVTNIFGNKYKKQITASISLKGQSMSGVALAFTTSYGTSPEGATRILTSDGTIKNVTYDFTNAENVYFQVGASVQETAVNNLDDIFANYEIMLNEGSTALPYEEYTGRTTFT